VTSDLMLFEEIIDARYKAVQNTQSTLWAEARISDY
jgi:hypothetical protein